MNKRGATGGDNTLLQTVIFIVLNLIFFTVLLTFAYKESSGASNYEQTYAKQIALMLDSAKPGMALTLDITNLAATADKNGIKDDIIKIDNEKSEVYVKVAKGKGYSFSYFTNYNANIQIKESDGMKYAIIVVEERQ